LSLLHESLCSFFLLILDTISIMLTSWRIPRPLLPQRPFPSFRKLFYLIIASDKLPEILTKQYLIMPPKFTMFLSWMLSKALSHSLLCEQDKIQRINLTLWIGKLFQRDKVTWMS
jgi:hypothetical protein